MKAFRLLTCAASQSCIAAYIRGWRSEAVLCFLSCIVGSLFGCILCSRRKRPSVDLLFRGYSEGGLVFLQIKHRFIRNPLRYISGISTHLLYLLYRFRSQASTTPRKSRCSLGASICSRPRKSCANHIGNRVRLAPQSLRKSGAPIQEILRASWVEDHNPIPQSKDCIVDHCRCNDDTL